MIGFFRNEGLLHCTQGSEFGHIWNSWNVCRVPLCCFGARGIVRERMVLPLVGGFPNLSACSLCRFSLTFSHRWSCWRGTKNKFESYPKIVAVRGELYRWFFIVFSREDTLEKKGGIMLFSYDKMANLTSRIEFCVGLFSLA